jgi:hypothetical protein
VCEFHGMWFVQFHSALNGEAVKHNVALKVAVVVLLAGCVVRLMWLSARTSFEPHVSCIMQGGVFKPVACSIWLSG